MQKKILSWQLSTFLVISIIGCSSGVNPQTIEKYDRDGLQFEYPASFSISTFFDPNIENPEIIVMKESISELALKCAEDKGFDEIQFYKNTLKKFKLVGLSSQIKSIDNLGCGWVMGNIYQEQYDVGENKGVYFNKALAQEYGGMAVFVSQLLVINQYDEVYTITFNYGGYEPIKKYLTSLEDPYEEHSLHHDTMDAWNEVFEYFELGTPIRTARLKVYAEGNEIFRDVLKTVKID